VKVGISTLHDHPLALTATETPEDLHLEAEAAEFIAPVEVSVKLTRMQEDVLAQGQTRTRVRMECSRCLEPVDIEIAGEFEALYVPESGAYGQRMGRRDFEWGDQRVNFYSELTIDLDQEIVQSLVIELPRKPLCRSDCAGICPTCGKDLNQGPCDCKPEPEDDVWGPLRDLISPADDESD
jgi:uncharacterized protein